MKETILIISVIIIIFIFLFLHIKEIKYVEAYSNTNKFYAVRASPNPQESANTIHDIVLRCTALKDYIVNKFNKNLYDDSNILKKYIPDLINRFDKIVWREDSPNNKYTSYTINKGEEIVMCIRDKNNPNIVHDINELMYVAIHEIGHVMCPENGHTPLFWEINTKLLDEALECNCGIYKYKDYLSDPQDYCGIKINNTLL